MARIGTTKTAFRILRELADQDMTVAEISESLDLPTSTIHDYLATLESVNAVTKVPDGYRTSSYFLKLGNQAREEHAVYEAAMPEMQKLASETGEFATLVIEENGYGVILKQAQGDKATHISLENAYGGIRTPLHATASGKAILAALPENRREALVHNNLNTHTDSTITDPDILSEQLDNIRDRGYALDEGELIEGMWGVAAPIRADGARRISAISLYGPTSRIERQVNYLADQVLEATNIIEINIDYS